MINSPKRPALWDRLGRTLLPSHGARANAADALVSEQRTRRDRSEAAAALHVADRASAGHVADRASAGHVAGTAADR